MAEKREIRRAFQHAVGDTIVFHAMVEPEACANRCRRQQSGVFACTAFLADRSGTGACILLSFQSTDVDPLVFAATWNYYQLREFSTEVCPGQVQAESCFNDLNGTSSTEPDCSSKVAAYNACTDTALQGCTNPMILELKLLRNATYVHICAADPLPPQSFLAPPDLRCQGPWTSFAMCLDCCEQGYAAAAHDCRVITADQGIAETSDPVCMMARWGKREACTGRCLASRPFDPIPPGSNASESSSDNSLNITFGSPPEDYVS